MNNIEYGMDFITIVISSFSLKSNYHFLKLIFNGNKIFKTVVNFLPIVLYRIIIKCIKFLNIFNDTFSCCLLLPKEAQTAMI